MRKLIAILVLLMTVCSLSAIGRSNKLFYVIEMKRSIDKSASRILSIGLKEADAKGADYIILHLNTYGGAVDAADSMRTALLRSKIPTIVFIDNQAASAGALISIACDSIYMSRGSSIGAATVVDQTGKVAPEKYQSFMRAMMRATAENKGRDPKIAEAMVDSAKVLSFTASEAMECGYCNGIALSIDSVASTISQGEEYTIEYQKLSWLDLLISFFMLPVVQGILLVCIIGGIYFEFHSPGIGLPSVIAVVGILLYFFPLYIEGLAQYWEILLFVIGVVLLLVEIFAIPGFGFFGISGIVLMLCGLVLAMIDNDLLFFGGTLNVAVLLKPLSIVIVSVFVAVAASIFLAGKLLRGKSRFAAIALHTELSKDEGFVGVEDNGNTLIGKEAIAMTPMKPSGKVVIDDRWYEASMEMGTAENGASLVVVRYEGGRVYCEHHPR